MSEEIYVPVKPVNPTTPQNSVRNACNAIRVGVDYDKGRGIYVSAYPAERKGDGIVSVLVTSGRSLLLDPIKRLNQKKVGVWQHFVAHSIEIKQDVVWDHILAVCAENGLAPAEPESAQVGG